MKINKRYIAMCIIAVIVLQKFTGNTLTDMFNNLYFIYDYGIISIFIPNYALGYYKVIK
jgi:hypothetical protein